VSQFCFLTLAKPHSEWFQLLEVNFPIIDSLWWRVLEIIKIRCTTNWPVLFWSCSLCYNTVEKAVARPVFIPQPTLSRKTDVRKGNGSKKSCIQCEITCLLIGWESVLERYVPFLWDPRQHFNKYS
jgi:hypothetical protein